MPIVDEALRDSSMDTDSKRVLVDTLANWHNKITEVLNKESNPND